MRRSKCQMNVLVVAVLIVSKAGDLSIKMEVSGSQVVACKEFGFHHVEMFLNVKVKLEVVSSPGLDGSFVDRWTKKLSCVALRLEVINCVGYPLIGPLVNESFWSVAKFASKGS